MTNPIIYKCKERGERKVFASVADLNLWLDMKDAEHEIERQARQAEHLAAVIDRLYKALDR